MSSKARQLSPRSQAMENEDRSDMPVDGPIPLDQIVGRLTGEGDDFVAPGGWAGTDDDTSTAPSDQMGMPKLDRLADITGGAVSDSDPVIENEYEPTEAVEEALTAVDESDSRNKIAKRSHA